VLSNLNAGTYRCRIERDGYITLEKEVVVKAATKSGTEAALTAAPPPPPPPAPVAPPPAAMPVLKPGPPVVVSLTDQMADDLVKSKDPIAEHSLGCSGATSAKLIRVKDVLPAHTHADADEVIYLITGDATLQMGGKDSMVGAGWMGLVPRGTSHTLTRRGTKVVLMLSVQSGPACAVMSAASDK
jgi:mannose-6-phosphate isomerase-like protein (cupin superfamily)